jgi:hypothetical protein
VSEKLLFQETVRQTFVIKRGTLGPHAVLVGAGLAHHLVLF